MSIANKLVTIAENEQKVYEAGKQAEYDRFWDIYQENGNKKSWEFAFAGGGWDDAVYNPKYPINVTGSASNMFSNSYRLISTKVPIILSGKNTPNVFTWSSALKTIPSIKVTDTVIYNSWFTNCIVLEEINFTEDSVIGNSINLSPCTKLTLGSLKSIISALKDFSGTNKEFTCTLTLSGESQAILNADGATAPNGLTWLEYAYSKCWNC